MLQFLISLWSLDYKGFDGEIIPLRVHTDIFIRTLVPNTRRILCILHTTRIKCCELLHFHLTAILSNCIIKGMYISNNSKEILICYDLSEKSYIL